MVGFQFSLRASCKVWVYPRLHIFAISIRPQPIRKNPSFELEGILFVSLIGVAKHFILGWSSFAL